MPVVPLVPVAPAPPPATVRTPVGPIKAHGAAVLVDRAPARAHAIDASPPVQTINGSRHARRNLLPQPASIGVRPGADVLPVVQQVVQSSVSHPAAPLSLAVVVALFLLIQHRIDRRDPKLTAAPRTEPADLEFGMAVRFA